MVVMRSSVDETLLRRRTVSKGVDGYITNVIGYTRHVPRGESPPPLGVLYPHAQLIEQDPGTAIPPHFHVVNQFQVIVNGSGFIGRMPVRPIQAHYTNAGTPYGPVRSGPEGMWLYTLRNSYDPGMNNMPGARDKLKAMPRTPRFATSQAAGSLPAEALPGLRQAEPLTLHAMETDGLGVWLHRLPPGQTLHGPEPRLGGGQFWIVLNGTMMRGEPLPRMSCLFVAPDEAPFLVQAGAGGLEVLALQYPQGLPAQQAQAA